MQLFIRNNGKTIEIFVEGSDSVAVIKQKIYEKEGFSVDSQLIIISGKEAKDEDTVEELELRKMANIHLLFKKEVNI
jgi:Ubiquitin family